MAKICISCRKSKTEVVEGRQITGAYSRTRRCLGCGHKFVTYEVAKDISSLRTLRRLFPKIQLLWEISEAWLSLLNKTKDL